MLSCGEPWVRGEPWKVPVVVPFGYNLLFRWDNNAIIKSRLILATPLLASIFSINSLGNSLNALAISSLTHSSSSYKSLITANFAFSTPLLSNAYCSGWIQIFDCSYYLRSFSKILRAISLKHKGLYDFSSSLLLFLDLLMVSIESTPKIWID